MQGGATTTTTTTTKSQRGPTRFHLRGVTLRRAGHHGQARNTFSPSPCWVLPIPASRPMSSGLFMCMALPPTEEMPNRRSGCSCGRRVIRSGRHPWATLASQTVPGRIHTGILELPWRIGWPRSAPRGQMGPDRDVRKTLRTVSFRAHRGHAEHHVPNIYLSHD